MSKKLIAGNVRAWRWICYALETNDSMPLGVIAKRCLSVFCFLYPE